MQNELKFQNEIDAAKKLCEILPKSELQDYIIVCASLDGVLIAENVAKFLNLSFEILFSEPIFAPNNDECEVAIVSETEEIVANEELISAFNITFDFIYGEAHRKYEEKILKNVYKYRKGKLLGDLQNKNILLIDEGCESGARAAVCVKSLVNLGAKSITFAVPFLPADVASSLDAIVDNLISVRKIANFVDVDFYYLDKISPSKDEILAILEESPHYLPLQK